MSEDQAPYKFLREVGADSFEEAIENIMAERQGMRELHDSNQALRILNRRLRVVIQQLEKAYISIENRGAIFLPPEALEAVRKAREVIKDIENSIAQSKELCEE